MDHNERKELKRILEEFDVESAKTLYAKNGGRGVSEDAVIVGLHKARVMAKFIDEKLREDSRKWLEDRGSSPYSK